MLLFFYGDNSIKKVLASGFLVGLLLGGWAFFYEPGYAHQVREFDVKITNWQRGPYKVVVMADVHVGSPYNGIEKLKKLVAMVNREKPNLVLLAGDFVIQGVVGGTFVEPSEIAQVLAKIESEDGVFAVLGNHDHWHNADQITYEFERNGMKMLTNRSVEVNGFWVAGVDDYWVGQPNVKKALSDITGELPVIMLTHNPDLFVHVPDRVALTIAGHTHGGQVYFPLVGRPIVPSKYGERFAIGLIEEQGRQLFVNPGTGTSIIPVRFLVPPEISVLNITSY